MADDRAVTYDPATTRGEVRLLVTDTRGEIFTDDEVDLAVTAGANKYQAAIYLLTILLVDAARRSRAYSRSEPGGVSMSYNDTAAISGIQAAIRELEKLGGAFPTLSVSMPALLPMDRGYDEATP